MLSFSFLILYRLGSKFGEFAATPELKQNEIEQLIHNNNETVIYFSDENFISSAEYAYSVFHNKIAFRHASSLEADKYCSKTPCAVGFKYGQLYFTYYLDSKESPIELANLCLNLTRPQTGILFYPEELRRIFNGPGTFLLGVDQQNPPSTYGGEIPYFGVPKSFFEYFNINVTDSLYVYRSTDRQLVRVAPDTYKKYIRSNLVNPESPNTKGLIFGYFPDDSYAIPGTRPTYKSVRPDNAEYTILKDLSSIYQDYSFSFFTEKISKINHLDGVRRPFFAAIDPKDPTNKFIFHHGIHNLETIKTFIENVTKNTQPKYIANECEGMYSICYDNYTSLVSSKQNMVIFFGEYKTKTFDKLRTEMAKKNILVYSYNLNSNDKPEQLDMQNYRSLIQIWKNGQKYELLGQHTFRHILSYIDNLKTEELNDLNEL